MAENFKVKTNWEVHEQGQKFIAKAINQYGRILAIASFDIPIDSGYDFSRYYGSDSSKLQQIAEARTIKQVEELAKASPEQ